MTVYDVQVLMNLQVWLGFRRITNFHDVMNAIYYPPMEESIDMHLSLLFSPKSVNLCTDAIFLLIVIRRQSVTCNRIISVSTGSRFRVLYHDQSDHHANSMAFIIVMKGAWSSHQGVT